MKIITIKHAHKIKNNFTGICKNNGYELYTFYKKGKVHNENFPAQMYTPGEKLFYYKNSFYGYRNAYHNAYTNKSWKKKVEELKYLESLEIFK